MIRFVLNFVDGAGIIAEGMWDWLYGLFGGKRRFPRD